MKPYHRKPSLGSKLGPGFTQTRAREIAREVDGIARTARPSGNRTHWLFGGWASKKDVWIVETPAGVIDSEPR